MQTSPVQSNQANAVSHSSACAKSQGVPDTPFSQMLTQQIADRSNSSSTATDTAKAADATQTSDANKADNSAQAGNNSTNAVSKQPDPANASDAKTADNDKTKSADDTQKADVNVQATPVSPELMALVQNHLNQLNAKSVDSSANATAVKSTLKTEMRTSPLAAQNMLQAQGKNLVADNSAAQALNGNTAASDTSTSNTASAKAEGGFAAALSTVDAKADDAKQAGQIVSAKLQDGLTSITTVTTPQLQQAALNLTQIVVPQAADKLTPAVGSPAWDQALGQKVVWMVAGEQQSASLTLNPPDLGPLHVVLHVSNGHADAAFTANQPEVRQALEAAMPKLREMMSDSGIQLGQATISAGMPNQQNRSGEQSSQNSRGSFGQSNDVVDAAPRVTSTAKIIGGQGLVDTFV